MLKMKLIWLVLIGLLLGSAITWAAPPQDYTLVYTFKNPDGTLFRTIKYYLRNGNKYRADYLSGAGAVNTIKIMRKDKGLVWLLDPGFKTYTETALAQGPWERAINEYYITDFNEFKKTGETKLLGYSCDMYETEGDGWSNIIVVAQDINVILKTESIENGKIVQIMEATEFRQEKPAAALFEIPAGYKRSE